MFLHEWLLHVPQQRAQVASWHKLHHKNKSISARGDRTIQVHRMRAPQFVHGFKLVQKRFALACVLFDELSVAILLVHRHVVVTGIDEIFVELQHLINRTMFGGGDRDPSRIALLDTLVGRASMQHPRWEISKFRGT